MTVQVKRFIELADILGLHLECKSCGCTLSLGSDRDGTVDTILSGNSKVIFECPACKTAWTRQISGAGYWDSEIKILFRKIRELKVLAPGFGCHVKLEIENEESHE